MNMLNALNPQQAGGFAQPMQDWRQMRPDHGAFQNREAFHSAFMDWRNQRPQGMHGNIGAMPQAPGQVPGQVPPQAPQPMPQQQFNFQPANMIGANYAVQALNPSNNPYQFGTYTPGG